MRRLPPKLEAGLALLCIGGCGAQVATSVNHLAHQPVVEVEPSAQTIGAQAVYLPAPELEARWFHGHRRERLVLRADYCVTTRGKTRDVVVGPGPEQARAELVRVVQRWRFKPHVVDGERVESCGAVEYVFEPR